MKAGWRCVLFC